MYEERGLSPPQIADLTFSSKKTILKYLGQFNIPLRKVDQSAIPQAIYGMKTINGRILPNKKEQRTIEKMKKLSDEGYSYRQIVEIVNALGLPPKHGRKWHLKVVFKILKR